MQASWQIDAFGTLYNAKKQGELSLVQAKVARQATQTAIVTGVANLYYSLQMLDEQLATTRSTLVLWHKNITAMEAMKEAGMTNAAALASAKAQVLQIESTVPTLEDNIRQLENSLAVLLHEAPHAIDRNPFTADGFPTTFSTGVPLSLLANRPDVAIAEAKLARTFYGVQAARGQFFPQITISGQGAFTNSLGGMIMNPGKCLASGIASLTQPLFAQGKINAVATEGNIDVLGSHLYGGEGINLNAKHDVNILAAGGRTKQEGTSKQEVRGLEVGGITNFIGKIRENGKMNSEQAATLSSRLESKGNINIHAGHHYNQNGSQVDAQGDVAVLAQKINVTAASNPYQGESSYTYQRKGLNIGISTPALSALQETGAAAQRMGQGSGRSSDLMSTATTAYKAYQAYKAVQNMNDPANGINIAATYAVQRSKTENDYHGNTLTPSTIDAGGKVYLQAQGAGAESDINITGSDVAGKMGTHLKAEHQINLYAASEEHHENNYNQNYNAAAGVAARAGKNGVALGVTAEGGEGKGYSHANSNRWRGSHIGDADSQTTLQSGEATTLSGSQAIGKGIQIQASALNIESLQDTSDYKGRQEYKGAGGTLGWGYYSGALDYSRSKLQGDATLVNRQAGVYAGDDGFQIDVAGATKNRGGIITSSKAAEEAGLNRFNTATLELEDIENHRNLKGSSISTSLGYTDGMEQEGQLNRGLGGGHIRENAYDTSRASINTQNITIRDEVAQQALTGESVGDTIARANQGIHTEDSAQHGSALTAIDNGEKLQRQLEADAEITQEFGKIAPRAINDIAESRGNLREYEQQQLAKATAEEALTRTSDPEKRAALQNYINERDSYLAANKANYDYWKEGGSGRNLPPRHSRRH